MHIMVYRSSCITGCIEGQAFQPKRREWFWLSRKTMRVVFVISPDRTAQFRLKYILMHIIHSSTEILDRCIKSATAGRRQSQIIELSENYIRLSFRTSSPGDKSGIEWSCNSADWNSYTWDQLCKAELYNRSFSHGSREGLSLGCLFTFVVPLWGKVTSQLAGFDPSETHDTVSAVQIRQNSSKSQVSKLYCFQEKRFWRDNGIMRISFSNFDSKCYPMQRVCQLWELSSESNCREIQSFRQ